MWVIPVLIALFAVPVAAKVIHRGRPFVAGDWSGGWLIDLLPPLGSLFAGLLLLLLGRTADQYVGLSIVGLVIVWGLVWFAGNEMGEIAYSAVGPPLYRQFLYALLAVAWPFAAPIVLSLTLASWVGTSSLAIPARLV